jgi:hypothetical protein
MMTLEEFRKIEDIYPNAVEWILEGWGYATGRLGTDLL